MESKINDRLIEEYFDIVATDAYERFADIITEDCVFQFMPIGHTFKGRSAVMSFVLTSGGARKHDKKSQVTITNWFKNDEYFCVEYEHALIINALHYRTKIDGYCLVFHIRDGKFDEVREYLNPSSTVMSFMTTYILRILPYAAGIKARRQAKQQERSKT